MLRCIAFFALIAGAAPFAHAAERSADEVQQCARRNLPERTARQEILLESTDAAGAAQRLEAELWWRRAEGDRSQLRITVEAPPDLRGSSFLLLQRENGSDLFSYLPELRTVRRLTGRAISGSLFGTDFSYEDLERIQLTAASAGVEALGESEIEGRTVDAIAASVPADAGSAYQRIVTYVDRETCVALRTDLESRPGTLAKQVSAPFAEVRQVGTRWVPHQVTIDDRETGRRTKLTVRKIDLDVDLSPSEFSQAALTRGR
jgi:outer membrane lipoprotein-sorting protein